MLIWWCGVRVCLRGARTNAQGMGSVSQAPAFVTLDGQVVHIVQKQANDVRSEDLEPLKNTCSKEVARD
eukprot:4631574-Amphidinium_carterae.1